MQARRTELVTETWILNGREETLSYSVTHIDPVPVPSACMFSPLPESPVKLPANPRPTTVDTFVVGEVSYPVRAVRHKPARHVKASRPLKVKAVPTVPNTSRSYIPSRDAFLASFVASGPIPHTFTMLAVRKRRTRRRAV